MGTVAERNLSAFKFPKVKSGATGTSLFRDVLLMTPFKLSWLFFAVVAGMLVHVFSTINSDIQNGSLWVYLIAFLQTFELHCNDTAQTLASFHHEIKKVSVYHSTSLSQLTPLCAEMPSLNTDAVRGYVHNIICSSLCQSHIICGHVGRKSSVSVSYSL